MKRLLRKLVRKCSNFTRGVLLVFGRLLGIKRDGPHRYDTGQLTTAAWIFFLGIPIGLILTGTEFPLWIWAAIVLGVLAISNADPAMMLVARIAEDGVDGVVEEEEPRVIPGPGDSYA
jgi:hypothetical protein